MTSTNRPSKETLIAGIKQSLSEIVSKTDDINAMQLMILDSEREAIMLKYNDNPDIDTVIIVLRHFIANLNSIPDPLETYVTSFILPVVETDVNDTFLGGHLRKFSELLPQFTLRDTEMVSDVIKYIYLTDPEFLDLIRIESDTLDSNTVLEELNDLINLFSNENSEVDLEDEDEDEDYLEDEDEEVEDVLELASTSALHNVIANYGDYNIRVLFGKGDFPFAFGFFHRQLDAAQHEVLVSTNGYSLV